MPAQKQLNYVENTHASFHSFLCSAEPTVVDRAGMLALFFGSGSPFKSKVKTQNNEMLPVIVNQEASAWQLNVTYVSAPSDTVGQIIRIECFSAIPSAHALQFGS